MAIEQKTCTRCLSTKPISEFYKEKGTKDGYRNHCKSCRRKDWNNWRNENKDHLKRYMRDFFLKRNYGISIEKYEEMYNSQNGKCYICGSHSDDQDKGLSVDHCHDSGQIRKLLCGNCNTALGSFKDSIDILKKAISYLEDHNVKK